MMYKIFISYSSADTDIVQNLRGQFAQYGISAWYIQMIKL